MSRIIFITGTDTGVGKTVVTCILIRYLRQRGLEVVALKPLCSGGRGDIRALHAAQEGELREEEICPFYFSEPVAPLIASRGRPVRLEEAAGVVRRMTRRYPWVLVEGAGGILSPLGRGWSAAEWVQRLGASVLVVAADRLGTINHTRLTVEALERRGCGEVRVMLNATARVGDRSVGSNGEVLRGILGRCWLGKVPWLGAQPLGVKAFEKKQKIFEKVLARFWGSYSFSTAL